MAKLRGWKGIVALFAMCAAMPVVASAQTFTSVLSFDGSNGAAPVTSLVQGIDGRLYGPAQSGGNLSTCGGGGCGTIFAITPAGTLTTLYNFCEQTNCSDGEYPIAGLTLTQNGNLFGTTYGGGLPVGGCDNGGCGTAFEITPAGALNTFYAYCPQSNCSGGIGPETSWLQAPDGDFYAPAPYGGNSTDAGTIYKMTTTGTLTALYSFCSQTHCSDGQNPLSPLILAPDGNFYGTTSEGGLKAYGTFFKITPSGTLTTLYTFCSQTDCTDGGYPAGGLVRASNGTFYGTTNVGGKDGYGTVFAITPEGKLTTMHSFHSGDGRGPEAGLLQATDGNFYGTTAMGGKYYKPDTVSGGTVFKITPKGGFTTLYNFCAETDCADGSLPAAGLVQDTSGIIYGTTLGGGSSSNCYAGCGTIFSLNAGLGPFVALIHDEGPVGQTGGILGQGFTGTTAVAINGTSADFTVVSDTFITATIPAGATSGYVTVTTPSGVLTSNVPFRVIP